ncbi:MAG: hypothetical protein UX84_C0018G0017, partial [Microgenomates group bacterium GW2011_GWD1_47_13]
WLSSKPPINILDTKIKIYFMAIIEVFDIHGLSIGKTSLEHPLAVLRSSDSAFDTIGVEQKDQKDFLEFFLWDLQGVISSFVLDPESTLAVLFHLETRAASQIQEITTLKGPPLLTGVLYKPVKDYLQQVNSNQNR